MDWELLRGKPFITRLGGLLKPKYKILGADLEICTANVPTPPPAPLIKIFCPACIFPIEDGNVVPVIDRCYPLREGAEALRFFGGGHAKGKVVVSVITKEMQHLPKEKVEGFRPIQSFHIAGPNPSL